MKKLLILLTLLFATQQASATSLLDTVLTTGWHKIKPTAKYKIEMYGYNSRIYEWTSKDGRKCLVLFSKSEVPQLDCD